MQAKALRIGQWFEFSIIELVVNDTDYRIVRLLDCLDNVAKVSASRVGVTIDKWVQICPCIMFAQFIV
jgi:hypothetical protein